MPVAFNRDRRRGRRRGLGSPRQRRVELVHAREGRPPYSLCPACASIRRRPSAASRPLGASADSEIAGSPASMCFLSGWRASSCRLTCAVCSPVRLRGWQTKPLETAVSSRLTAFLQCDALCTAVHSMGVQSPSAARARRYGDEAASFPGPRPSEKVGHLGGGASYSRFFARPWASRCTGSSPSYPSR